MMEVIVMKDKIILYGAGNVGEDNYLFLDYMGMKDYIVAFCDKNADVIIKKHEKDVIDYEEAKRLDMPFVIAVTESGEGIYKEIKDKLQADGVEYYNNLIEYLIKCTNKDMVEINRDWCAFHHISGMDWYFDIAESEKALNIFWGEKSEFFDMFKKLNLESVVELACGRGRHIQKYQSEAGDITLVDILDKNIEFVKERFKDYSNIHYYKNNGYDLSELNNDSYTALFVYDAMVHFELMDIFSYLKETYRILKSGGMALFHHSNNSSDYKNSSKNPVHGRNFMDKNLFAYLAYRAGLEIVEQRVIDWGGVPNLDCITLVRK